MKDRTLRAALRQAWHEAPTMASIRVLRWTTGGYYLFGGLIVLSGSFVLDERAEDRAVVGAIALFGVVVGLGVLRWGARIDRWGYHLLVLLATGLITGQIAVTGSGADAVAVGSAYLFVMVNAVLLFPLREGLVQMVVVQAAFALMLAGSAASPGAGIIVVGCTIGMTVIVGWLARVASAAEVDPLTDLLNRRGVDRRLEEAQRRAERDGSHLCLALLDLDCFKKVNDDDGHAVGDRLLVECARTWLERLPEGMHLGRYSGDGFALVMPGTPLGRAADIVEDLRTCVQPGVTASAGVTGWQHGDTGSVLMGRADVALYEAKTAGRDQIVVYGDPERTASALETAIAEGQMRLYLQPVVRIANGEPVGFEALVRWEHPRRGLVMPDAFITQAERTGAIHSLGAWTMEHACRAAVDLDNPEISIGVNVTIPELRRTDYADAVGRILERWGLPGHQLILEITEGAFDDSDPQIEQTLRDVRALGVPIAIDDFGSGQSSLRRIEHMAIDILKVDGALVRAIREDAHEAPILEAVQTMARRLGLRLVAEHVETPHQAEVLRRVGYDFGQGYLFGRPAPAATFIADELPGVESNHRR